MFFSCLMKGYEKNRRHISRTDREEGLRRKALALGIAAGSYIYYLKFLDPSSAIEPKEKSGAED